ncbi:IgaA/UmoB family intracellular growth attenuator [Xenorhabdus innexi]|uniref:Flagellar operon control protein umoB n=1 Tax=Xenorhabdus innexi TaxID=290109 RepID=A0A1N6MRE0_9GAMM|nr:IgaA/UmoB family intracellular growth attenuator [Xenorhabdus innexi]PHM33172.1 intracellular growth attenuator protein IgaA [Xenorhabdus innexi]SIP71397.1 Flagellar operon control protein umoB [Xenorhabdus innexi]
MSSLVIILAIFIISLTIMVSFLTFRWKRSDNAHYMSLKTNTATRKLNAVEFQVIEAYLKNILPQTKSDRSYMSGYPVFPIRDNNVYTISHTITRFSAVSGEKQHWRYYIDETELYFPALLEPFVNQRNTIDIVETSSIPLVIAVNGHSLTDYQQDLLVTPNIKKAAHASIQKNGNSNANLLYLRKETPEEYRLRHSTGIQEGALMCVGLSLWFLALFVPSPLLPWLMLVSVLFILASFWPFFRLPFSRHLLNISCFSGILKRWGVFSEFEQENKKNISLGGVDLVYPVHWEPYIVHELDQHTDVEMYSNCHVIRQGPHLSLHEEEKHYPYQRYRKNQMLVVFSVLAMLVLYFYQPVSLSMKLSFAWLHGSNTKVITDVSELLSMPLREGDVLRVKGTGMCYMPPKSEKLPGQSRLSFMPFDCLGIYWNNGNLLPIPESDIINKASALLTTVNEQLRPMEHNRKYNPSLNEVIAKSGMTLLDNFSQIILKTNALCQKENDCSRLKNALVNLSNAKSWDDLLSQTEKGKLNGTKVLLRSVSADALGKLVDTTTASFIYRETDRFSILLNSPPPGGVLLMSDEERPLVEYPVTALITYDATALQRWHELLRLVGVLMHMPFETKGIVTGLSEDANGTLHIMLHSEPDSMTLSRYLGSCLFLAVLMATLIVNGMLVIKKKQKNRLRLMHIKQYYDRCFNVKEQSMN